MATVALTLWYDEVAPHVPGCPLPVILQKTRAAAIAWAKKTRCWRYLGLTAIDAVAHQQTYTIGAAANQGTLPAETQVVHIFQLNYDGTPLTPRTPAQFRALSDTWFSDEGDPTDFALFNEGKPSLWKIPSADAVGAIRIPEVALAPTEAALNVDDTFYNEHKGAIALGARSLILGIPKKPYTDLNLSMSLWEDFEAKAGSIDARVASGRGHARLRSKTIIR